LCCEKKVRKKKRKGKKTKKEHTEDDGVVVHSANGLVESLVQRGEVLGVRISRTKQKAELRVDPPRPGLLFDHEREKQTRFFMVSNHATRKTHTNTSSE